MRNDNNFIEQLEANISHLILSGTDINKMSVKDFYDLLANKNLEKSQVGQSQGVRTNWHDDRMYVERYY